MLSARVRAAAAADMEALARRQPRLRTGRPPTRSAVSLIGPLLLAHPALVPGVPAWARHRNLWVRRAAAVGLDPLASTGSRARRRLPGRPLAARRRRGSHSESRRLDASRSRQGRSARLERTSRQRTAMPRTTVRYAIERFPEARRQRLLLEPAQPRAGFAPPRDPQSAALQFGYSQSAARGIPFGIEINPWNLTRLAPAPWRVRRSFAEAEPVDTGGGSAECRSSPPPFPIHARSTSTAAQGVQVPMREIALSGGEPPLRVYDTSGPQDIDVDERPAEAARAVGRAPTARARRGWRGR